VPMAQSPVTTLFPQHDPTPGRFGCTEAVTNATEYHFRRPGTYDGNNALKPLEQCEFANATAVLRVACSSYQACAAALTRVPLQCYIPIHMLRAAGSPFIQDANNGRDVCTQCK
jgi:hypothetical protein